MFKRSLIGFTTTISTFVVVNSETKAQPAPTLPPSQIPQPPSLPSDTIQVPEIEREPIETPSIPEPTFTPEIPQVEETIFISEFRFIGNTVFTDEQLLEVAQTYLNREVSFAELVQLRSEITDLYVNSGYTTSGAFLPIEENQAVNIRSATIAIQVVEGTVEEIDFSGDEHLNQYVIARLDNAIAPVLNQPKLEEALRLLQIDPLIASISANLSAGNQVGSSILTVQAEAEPSFRARIGTDNYRAPSTGSIQAEAQLSAANLLAWGEELRIGYSLTEGSDGFSAGISVPINESNTTLAFDYAQLEGQIVEEPLDDFDIQTDSQVYSLSLRHPLIRKASESSIEEFALGISANRIESETTVAGFPFPLSPGADEDGRTQITELTLSQEYLRQTRANALLMRSRLGLGLGAFDSTGGAEPNGQFLVWRGQALWLQSIGEESQLTISGDIQLTSDQLVPVRQFSIGGPTSVRGYRQDAIIADNGLTVTAEIEIPVLELGSNQQLSLIPFAGTGVGWNNGGDRALEQNILASVGVGMQYEWEELTARLNYAVPFSEVGIDGESLQEDGLDFSLVYQFRFKIRLYDTGPLTQAVRRGAELIRFVVLSVNRIVPSPLDNQP
ncbi:MAG: ShlB/FhaC/HecB family hemolysin secretion/activation protein [Cyanobacteria bacterium P01_D01_bin.1]